MSNKGRTADNEELSLWDRFVSGISPMHDRPKAAEDNKPPSSPKKSRRNHHTPPVSQPPPSVPITAMDNQLDRKTLSKLKSGKMSVEGILDLHDKNQDQAYNALVGFVTRAFQANHRCVLVITGKGTRTKSEGFWSSTQDGVGVLKSRLPDWVSTPPLNDIVLRAHPAHRKHGGEGAFYLYLKNNRPKL